MSIGIPLRSRRDFKSAAASGFDKSMPSTATLTALFLRRFSASVSIGWVRRATSTRLKFFSARSLANSVPNPLDAPVTSAHLPAAFSIVVLDSLIRHLLDAQVQQEQKNPAQVERTRILCP